MGGLLCAKYGLGIDERQETRSSWRRRVPQETQRATATVRKNSVRPFRSRRMPETAPPAYRFGSGDLNFHYPEHDFYCFLLGIRGRVLRAVRGRNEGGDSGTACGGCWRRTRRVCEEERAGLGVGVPSASLAAGAVEHYGLVLSHAARPRGLPAFANSLAGTLLRIISDGIPSLRRERHRGR